MLHTATQNLKLHQKGIYPDLFGSHSLQEGGSMALKIHGYDNTTIQKIGRWNSLTFLQYIHNQIGHLSKYVSKNMSIALSFLNIADIEVIHA